MRTRVYLVRHGSVVGAETRRFIGHVDIPLSPLGEAQIEGIAVRLARAKFGAVYSSDLDRARRSAQILAAPHGLTPVELPELREFAMGRWEGMSAEEIRAADPVAFDAWMASVGGFQFPGGECLAEVAARAWRAFERIVTAHAGESVAVVAHGGPNRAILCLALGLPLDRILALGQEYAALSLIERCGTRWRLLLLNQCEPMMSPP